MRKITLPWTTPDTAAFEPFGRFIAPPDATYTRAIYSDSLAGADGDRQPALHVNNIPPSDLELSVTRMERHPFANQIFVPLDVSRYVIVVAPSNEDGMPDNTRAVAFLMAGNRGVIYHKNVWHASATVVDRPGCFAVLMWRNGVDDDEFLDITPLHLAVPHANISRLQDEVSKFPMKEQLG